MIDRSRMLQDIADTADALTEPHQHHEPIHDYDQHRNKRMRRVYTTTQPGLLHALWEAIEPGRADTNGAQGGGFGSAPPLCLEALSRHTAIQIGVTWLCWTIGTPQRDTTASSIRALVGAAANIDSDAQRFMLRELRTWRTWCAVMTGWQTPAYAPNVPCPACEKASGLRINLGRKTAMCIHCDARWDEDRIGVLADYVRATKEAA
jgi:hypothetical protein